MKYNCNNDNNNIVIIVIIKKKLYASNLFTNSLVYKLYIMRNLEICNFKHECVKMMNTFLIKMNL